MNFGTDKDGTSLDKSFLLDKSGKLVSVGIIIKGNNAMGLGDFLFLKNDIGNMHAYNQSLIPKEKLAPIEIKHNLFFNDKDHNRTRSITDLLIVTPILWNDED